MAPAFSVGWLPGGTSSTLVDLSQRQGFCSVMPGWRYQGGECDRAGNVMAWQAGIRAGKEPPAMNTNQPAAALQDELRVIDGDLARLRETAADLRRRIGECADDPTDPVERAALIEQAEEQEALIDVLEARREQLVRELGRPGTDAGQAG
jgi:hypothetical protein